MCVLRARGRRPKTEHLEIILGVLLRFVAKKKPADGLWQVWRGGRSVPSTQGQRDLGRVCLHKPRGT